MERCRSKWQFMVVMALLWLVVPSKARAITLSEALEYAVLHAEAAHMAQLRQQAGQFGARGDTAFIRPQIKALGRYMELESNAETSAPFLVLPEREIGAELQFSQLLWSGGRISGSRALEKVRLKQSQFLRAVLLRDLRLSVKKAFDGTLFQKAISDIHQKRHGQREEELEDAKALWEAGLVTRLDVRQAELNVNLNLDAWKKAQADQEQALVAFNTTLGRSQAEKRLIPDGQLLPIGQLSKLLDEVAAGLGENTLLELKNAREALESARLQYEISGGDRWPQIVLVSNLESQGEDLDELDESAALGIRVEWSILDGGARNNRRGAARAEYDYSRKALQKIRKDLSGQLAQLRVGQTSLAKRLILQKKSVALAHENYEDARGQYRAGTITLTRLGDFNLAHTEAQFGLLRIYFEQRRIHHLTVFMLEKPNF